MSAEASVDRRGGRFAGSGRDRSHLSVVETSVDTPKGVLLVQGLGCNSISMQGMGAHVDRVPGYKAFYVNGGIAGIFDSNLGVNIASSLDSAVKRVTDTTQQPAALLGVSLGGVQAVEFAFTHPEVDEVISVDGPIAAMRGKPDRLQATTIFEEADLVVPKIPIPFTTEVYDMADNVDFDRRIQVPGLKVHGAVVWDGAVQRLVARQLGRTDREVPPPVRRYVS